MRKRIRRVLQAVVVVVVLVGVGVILVALFADRLLRVAVERAGTKTLNVGVTVQKADVALFAGSLDLRTIRVANPAGYTGPALLTLQRVDIAADTGSLLGDQVLIKDMQLDGMEVFVEQQALRNNLHEVIQPLREPRPPTGKSLIVDNLEIANVTVHVALSGVPGQAQSADFQLAPIRMTELGRHERIDTAVLIGKIVLAIAAGVAQQSGDILPKETIGEITGILDKVLDLGRTIFGSPKDADANQPRTTDDLGESVPKTLQDLLGGPKKQ